MVRHRSFPILVLCLFASLPALAATHVWTGAADDRFSNSANWIGGSPAGDASAAISFPASSRATATNDLNGLTIQSIAFSAGGFTISGNAITVAANATVIDTSLGTNTIACNLVLAGDAAVAVTGSIYDHNGLVLSGAISGSGGITLRGGGHLAYTGSQPNSYSGLTRVLYGDLQLKKAANVTAIAGDLDVENDGFNYEYGFLSIFNDEQIANSSHVTVGYLATVNCGATETLGPVTLTRSSTLQTSVGSGTSQSSGTIIFAGDIEVTGIGSGDIHTYGTFLLQGTRTINATASYGVLINYSGPGQATPGSGIILNAPANSDGTFSDVLEFRQATYDGPTTLKGGSVRIEAPRSVVDLQDGRYSGHCKSLTAEGGVLNLHSYLGGVTSDGDVKLSAPVILAHEVGTALTMNGALDLGGATLQIDNTPAFNYGAVYKVVDNTSTKPVTGRFAGLPEGSMIANRYTISYAGGDGNDVTLTDVGLVPSSVSLDVSPYYPQTGTPIDFKATVSSYQQTPTGTVTFSADTTVLGTVPVTNGVAKLSAGASLPRGHYIATATYSGNSRVAPSTSSNVNLYVVAPTPTLTSIDPPAITAGVKTTLTIHGTNFVDGSYVLISSSGFGTTFVSPTELRIDYTPFESESDYQQEVWVSQPDTYGAQQTARMKLNVTGVKKPASPFTFASDLTSTLKGVTPGAMTLWLAVARAGGVIFTIDNIVNDTDHDGSVTLPFPFKVTSLPPYGIWLVADLSAHTIAFDNPSRTAYAGSPFPSKAFLRDSDGNYTHVQFAAAGIPSTFAWARPGIGAWMTIMADGASLDEDLGPNHRVTFETPSMKRTIGTTAPPPADGIRAGDMFLVIDGYGQEWWGDAVDQHLSESNGAGKLGFAIASTNALENSGSAKILVERTEGTDGTVTVQYATADGTAIAGRNYAAQASEVTFGPGEILKTISIPLLDDQSYGGGGQFKVNLSSPAGASIGVATNTVTIDDDEQPPVLSWQLPSTSVSEGDAGRVDIPITVKLTGATSLPVTVNWYFAEGQYGVPHTGELQFAPGETQKTFTASYAANTIPEPNRFLTLHLWNANHAAMPEDSRITIVDDDFAGVSVADASVVESAGKVVVPLQLSRASQKPVTVTYETRNGTALAGADYVTTSGTMTVGQYSSITIPLLNDSFHETLESFEIVLTSVNGGKLDRSVAAVIIADDDADAPPPPAPPRRRTAPH